MIESDIQKLNPGALVDLFELDATALGGEVLRWHAGVNGLGNDIVWQGNTYARFPVEASGFAKSGQGQLPRPKIQVANVTGLVGALARELNDLVGAKLIRRRTFVRYLDSANFPPIMLGSPAFVSRASTGTYYGSTGLLLTAGVDVPRYTHHPQTLASLGLLLEGSATNLLKYSEQLDNSANWLKTRSTVTANATVAPDGNSTADLVSQSATSDWYIYQPATLTAGVTYCSSVYFKPSATATSSISVYLHSTAFGSNIAVGWDRNQDAAVAFSNNPLAFGLDKLPNGWRRLWLSGTATTTVTTNFAALYWSRTGTMGTYTGAPDPAGQGYYLWGGQLEVGSTPTSYIPTVASTVTRAADISTTTLPGNPTADPNCGFPDEVWFVDRKVSENGIFVEFELTAAFDVIGVMLPRRQCIQNVCTWRYRSAECSYTGGPVADITDAPTSNAAQDQCGKRLASCKLRFGQYAELPFGGFPGTGLVR